MTNTTTAIVTLTPEARGEVRKLLREQDQEGLGLRLGVAGGGCSGLSYRLEFTRQEPGDSVQELDEGFRVFLDPKSVLYLKGVTLDHRGGLDGRGFVFENPNAENTCGCGESFSA